METRSKSGRTVTLNNGVEMPVIGLGTWQVPASKARQSVLWALQAGYRMVDTSLDYGNEREVGQGIRDSGIPREEIFVTTKLEHQDHGAHRAIGGFQTSLNNLDIGYVDLYLVHWPPAEEGVATWEAMEEVLDGGRCRAIGVSNYAIRHLEEILASGRVTPAVNQVKIHPFLYPQRLIDYCTERRIQVESYSPLTRGDQLRHPQIVRMAERLGRTPAQVMLRWHLQHGLIAIPRSVSREHIEGNFAVFDFSLSDDDMELLDSLHED